MKNFKKVVALVLALVMVLSLSVPAFAAEMTAAEKATTLEILKGEGEGVTAEYLAKTPTRLQAAIISLRLRGLEAEALAYEGTEMFDDHEDISWAGGKAVASYLKANPELGWVGTDGKLMPNDPIVAQAYVKVMLEALGYKQDTDFTWAEVFTFAADKGLVGLTATTVMTNDSLAVGSVEALAATNADGEVLVDVLVAAEAIDEAKAIEAGLVEAVVALAVEGVAMTNLIEVDVTLNQEIAAAKAVAANFEVKVGTAVKAIDSVVQDGAKLTLVVTQGAIAQQDDVVVTVKKAAGLEADVATTLTNVLDKEVPEVASVTVSGPNKFEVTYTEPLKTAPTAEINNGAIFASVSGFVLGGKTVTVTAGATLTDGEAYTIKLTGATDFANYTAIAYAGATTYVKSAAGVTVEVVSVKEEEVKIKFSAPVKVADLGTADFYHTFSAFAPNSVTPKDGSATYEDEFTLAFTTYKVGYVTTNLTVLKADVLDEWGNKMAADTMLPIVAVKDEVAPTVSVVEVKDNSLTVKFSEEVKAFTTANVVMKDADGDVVSVSSVTVDADDATKYVIAYASQEGGAYTFEIKDVVDKSLAENKLDPAPTTLTATITDTTAPVISTATAVYSGQVVFVTFPEAMNDTVINKDSWRLTVGTQFAPTKAEFWGTSAKEVKLTFADGVTVASATALIIGKVADASGNSVDALFTSYAAPSAASNAEILEVKTIAENKVTIKVAGKITEGLTANNINVIGNATSASAASISSTFVDDGVNTLITAQLKANLTFAAAEKPTGVALSNMKIDKGFDVASTTTAAAAYKDGIAPSKTAVASASATTLTVTFDEDLDTTAGVSLLALDFVVTVDGTVKTAITDYTTTEASGVVTITLATAPGAGKVVKVDTVAAPMYLMDSSKNKANAIGDEVSTTF